MWRIAGIGSLVIYLLAVGIGSALLVIVNFPSTVSVDEGGLRIVFPVSASNEDMAIGAVSTPVDAGQVKENDEGDDSDQIRSVGFRGLFLGMELPLSRSQALLLLAFLSGIAGSFLHAAQSLASYVGNGTLKFSWALWYILRPWIGGVLGMTIFLVFSAGLIGGMNLVDPRAIVGLGLLGGWFSKTTTDKLKEVFETLFKTDEDEQRKDKLNEAPRPEINEVNPNPLDPSQIKMLTVTGLGFMEHATVQLADDELAPDVVTFRAENELQVSLEGWSGWPAAGESLRVRVRNPNGKERLSKPFDLVIE